MLIRGSSKVKVRVKVNPKIKEKIQGEMGTDEDTL